MVADGSHMCGEHSITHSRGESLLLDPDINVTLHVNYTQIKKKKLRLFK